MLMYRYYILKSATSYFLWFIGGTTVLNIIFSFCDIIIRFFLTHLAIKENKKRNVLKQIFELMSFFCAFLRYGQFLYSAFVVNWGLRDFWTQELDLETQSSDTREPVVSQITFHQFTFQSKRIWDLWAEPPVEVVRALHKDWRFRGQWPLT